MLRQFTDSNGVTWRIWNVDPTTPHIPKVRQRRKSQPVNGWLVCESDKERRRLSPVPEDWEQCDVATLEQYCQRAERVPNIALSPRNRSR